MVCWLHGSLCAATARPSNPNNLPNRARRSIMMSFVVLSCSQEFLTIYQWPTSETGSTRLTTTNGQWIYCLCTLALSLMSNEDLPHGRHVGQTCHLPAASTVLQQHLPGGNRPLFQSPSDTTSNLVMHKSSHSMPEFLLTGNSITRVHFPEEFGRLFPVPS